MNENKQRTVPPELLFSDYSLLFDSADEDVRLPVIVSGSSMSPFLKHNRDKVFLSRIESSPKRGDIILYRRSPKEFVLHRVYSVKNGAMTMVGDGQIYLEPDVPIERAEAIVSFVIRDGKKLSPSSPCWIFYEKIWLTLFPFRPVITKIHAFFKRKIKRND